jgi:ADP-ribose pyrophosphatase YjhB (NUDIX family)
MYKVFLNEQTIFLYSEQEDFADHSPIKIQTANDFRPLWLQFLESDEDLHLVAENQDLLLGILKDEFKYLEAAGGLVSNLNDELLFIYRLDCWDLPKGKIESGESPETAAHREIEEECGISSHKIDKKLCDTYHMYQMNGEYHLKKTYWFAFNSDSDNDEELTPQTEEDIEQVVWFDSDEIELALMESYESIREVYKAFNE